ncbi:MAG: hypothetical protein ACTHZX_01790 [Microbacterium sp.]
MTDPQQPRQYPQPPYAGGGAPQGQQPYGNPQGAAYGYPASKPSGGARSGLAWTAIIIAVATVFVSPIVNAVLQKMILNGGNGNFELFTILQLVFNGLVPALLAAVGIVLGIIAARGTGKLLAGIAIGLNAMVVGSTIIGYGLQALLTPLLY